MNRFTVEETNLMSIYSEGGKREVSVFAAHNIAIRC